jgi:hypothetical protein
MPYLARQHEYGKDSYYYAGGRSFQNVELPPGVLVVVMDFDTEGVDPADVNYYEQGDPYVRSLWGPLPQQIRGGGSGSALSRLV